MKVFNFSCKLVALAFLVSIGLSCSDNDKAPDPTYDVALKETTAGKALVDSSGKTLYFFTKDVAGTSACSGGCVDTWPLFSKKASKLDPALNAADFGTITRADGKTQTTYKGWPLYYYKNDAAPGDAKGENVGSIWFVAKPDYTIMFANAQLIGKDGKLYTSDYKEGTGETQFFVDGMGRTLYAFVNDTKNKNKFTTNVETHDASWPIYVAEIKDLPSTLDKSLFTTIDVFGKKQLTYKGWPLYYFGNDNQKRGLTKGVDSPRTGVWPIVNKESPVAPD